MENFGDLQARLQVLFELVYNGKANVEEEAAFRLLVQDERLKEQLSQLLRNAWDSQEGQPVLSRDQSGSIFSAILKGPEPSRYVPVKTLRSVLIHLKKYSIAACLIGLIAVAYWFITPSERSADLATGQKTSPSNKIIAPGKDGAVLTLADGKKVVLDSAGNGIVTNQGNVNISKAGGQIVYSGKTTSVVYNTMSTPRGRQYSLILGDGSKVWLNAASSIRFPTAFTGKERRVEITGEVYFEIAHNAGMPFHVAVNNADIEVLGTHFNVNAYSDEPVMKTTLLEGKVRLTNQNNSGLLVPGDQAQVSGTKNFKIVKDVDLDDVVSWKNGLFSLKGSDLETLMRQISRWYDVDVLFKGNLPQKNFVGEISRNVNLSDVLLALWEFGINARLENEKLVVSQR